jgi:LuxR family transcriptional regulator, quorum-sensing system regulator BjaR1
MLDRVMRLAEPVLAAATPATASAAFHKGARALGASYLQTRLYRRPARALTSISHWQAGGFVLREARSGWVGSPGFDYVCFTCNPLLDAIRSGRTRYRFSDFAPRRDRRFGVYWEALSEAAIGEAICATAYGPGRATASLHLGFDGAEIDRETAEIVSLAGGMLVEKLLTLSAPPAEPEETAALTPRERDVLSYVAEGKTDWEIGAILGFSEATARFHADNARRKLGAVNRAHAVARFLAGSASG